MCVKTEAWKERESKREVCYLQPAAGIEKGREEEEPLICPVTGLGQLICCRRYCWEVEERKCKRRSSNTVSLLPADLKTLFITTHFHRMSPPRNIQYRINVLIWTQCFYRADLSLRSLRPFSFLPLQILVGSWSDGDSSSFIMFWVRSFQRTLPPWNRN